MATVNNGVQQSPSAVQTPVLPPVYRAIGAPIEAAPVDVPAIIAALAATAEVIGTLPAAIANRCHGRSVNAITINRGEPTAIAFMITDANAGLAGKRVTWSVARSPLLTALLRKVGGLPGSTPDITIASQTAGEIIGAINISAADFTILAAASYAATLWIDDGVGGDRCVSHYGHDELVIVPNVLRT